MRTIIWFFYFWSYLLVLMPRMHKARRLDRAGKVAERDAIVNREVPRWANRLLNLAGAKVTVRGQENLPQQAAVFISNHQGYFDIPILLTRLGRPYPLIAKQELAKLPWIRDWMELLQCRFIQRDNPRQAVTQLNLAAQALKEEGRSFIIFPEGTRSRGDQMGEFKSGGFKVAAKTGAPIVPVAIDGSYRLMEANGMWIRPAQVTVTILPPIATNELSREEIRELPQRVAEEIRRAKAEKPSGASGKGYSQI